MKFLKKLYWSLIIRHVIFLLTTVIITTTFIIGTILLNFTAVGEHFSEHPNRVKDLIIPIKSVEYDNKSKDFKISPDISDGTWVEILKDNKVIFTKGKKLDKKLEYTQEEIAIIANNIYNLVFYGDEVDNTISDVISYEYIPFTGTDGENYTLLIKSLNNYEKFDLKISYNMPAALRGTKLKEEIDRNSSTLFWIFIFAIICIILLFSRLTSKKIIKPLNELNKGVENVINGDYSARLDFKGSYEFKQLRDAFNYMTEMLQNAERENRRISDSKKKILLDISHDLRTPATTIQGYAEALHNDLVKNDEKKKMYLKYIYEKSKRVTDLIETLFKYSKLESSVYDMNKEVNDLCEFLRSVIISYYGELEAKEFNLDIRIPNRRILFNFDKIEMERVFSNIIANVIKYNSKGTTLTVLLEEAKDGIQISICDDGVGIPCDVQKNIFNALVRGDNARKTDGGMGLGLAISKKIVVLHGGIINLESEHGKGSNFYIEFKKY